MSALTGRSPRDANRVPALFAVSTVDGVTVVPLEANPANGALQVEGSIVVTPTTATNAYTSSTTIDDNGATLWGADPARLGGSIYNKGTDSCYICFFNGPSTISFTVKMVSGSYYEVPYTYTGEVTAICDTAETAGLTWVEFF